jgi:hypothetical protein
MSEVDESGAEYHKHILFLVCSQYRRFNRRLCCSICDVVCDCYWCKQYKDGDVESGRFPACALLPSILNRDLLKDGLLFTPEVVNIVADAFNELEFIKNPK